MSTIRGQFQQQFATLKAAFQENGSVAGVETAYASDDGNVKLSVRGMALSDGRQYVSYTFSTNGAEAGTLQRALSGGLDPTTGLPASMGEGYGETNGSGSDLVDGAEDFDALAKKFADGLLETQAQQDAETKSWVIGDKTFTSLEDYQAYNRVTQAADEAAWAMAQKMTFASNQEMGDFVVKTRDALAAAMRGEGSTDLSSLLKDVPADALKAGLKALDKKNSDAERLIGFLTDYLAARKADTEKRRVSLLV